MAQESTDLSSFVVVIHNKDTLNATTFAIPLARLFTNSTPATLLVSQKVVIL
jgi:hypothetical protein